MVGEIQRKLTWHANAGRRRRQPHGRHLLGPHVRNISYFDLATWPELETILAIDNQKKIRSHHTWLLKYRGKLPGTPVRADGADIRKAATSAALT